MPDDYWDRFDAWLASEPDPEIAALEAPAPVEAPEPPTLREKFFRFYNGSTDWIPPSAAPVGLEPGDAS